MTNRKVIVAIVLFIICGLFIYSFANPLDSSELDEPIEDGSGIVVEKKDNKDKKEEKEDLNEEEKKEEETPPTEEEPNETLIVQTTPKRTYNTGNRVTTGNTSNTGNNSSNNNSNSGNSGNQNATPTPTPPAPVIKKSGTTIARIGYTNENSEIGMRQTGNTIEYGGRTDSNLIKIKIESTDTFNVEELKNASVTVSSREAGVNSLTDRIAIDTTTNHAYVEFEYAYQKINDGNDELGPTNYDQLQVSVDWGYGIKENYTLILKIEKI